MPKNGIVTVVPAPASVSIVCLVLAATNSLAGITLEREQNVLWVTDCLECAPCTPSALRRVDRMNGWGKVTYDASSDTTTVDANLWVGANDGTETFVQIGSEAHPRESLVVRGDVIVFPFYIPGENPKRDWRSAPGPVNRLTIGVDSRPDITPALRIFSEPGNERTLYVGCTPAALSGLERGGELRVFHGALTAAVQDKEHAIGTRPPHRMLYLGGRVVLKGATLSWMADKMAYRLRNAVLEDTVFEHSGTAILGRAHTLKGCTFRNLGTALLDYGNLDITCTDCVFENNLRHWVLRFTGQGLTCIDCKWDQPKLANEYISYVYPRTGEIRYPWFRSQRHLVVEVVDAAGNPVEAAEVSATSESGDGEAAVHGTARTDEKGRTPGKGAQGAMLLTEIVERATDTRNKPTVTKHSYEIRAVAPDGRTAVMRSICPTRSWQVVRLVVD